MYNGASNSRLYPKCPKIAKYGFRLNIPSDFRMREIRDEIDPKKYPSPIFKVLFRHLQRKGKLSIKKEASGVAD